MANEKRLIDANAALEKLCEYCSCGCYEECEERCVEFRNISKLPTVEAVEVVHGRWIQDTQSKFEHRYNCSACNYRLIDVPCNYCPNCGADMRERKDNENTV